MRSSWIVGGACFAQLAGCAPEPPKPVDADALVLELGGQHRLLSEALAAVAPGGARKPAPAAAQPSTGAPREATADRRPAASGADPAANRVPAESPPGPDSEPAQVPDYDEVGTPVESAAAEPPPAPIGPRREVSLDAGQTLFELARVHLGDGNRFHELLELNGWSEAQARRLPVGTVVQLPPR